jgi:S-adenosylmethionine-diacylgycerolhomoserine-N-methlytransferase
MTAVAASTALMNRIYRRQRHVYDLTRKYFLLGRDRLIEGLDAEPFDGVLEIGCGTGRNLVLAAQRYPNTRFFGIDVSTVMLTSAIEQIDRAGIAARVRVAHADATSFDPSRLFGRVQFERVFISYSLSMIPGWQAAVDRAIDLLAPGGELHIVDFGTQERLPRVFKFLLRRWLALFHVTPRDTLERWLARRAPTTGRQADAPPRRLDLPGSSRSGHAETDRHRDCEAEFEIVR